MLVRQGKYFLTSVIKIVLVSHFMNQRKAYDTVNQHLSLDKLYASVTRRLVLDWFISYLSDRSQCCSYWRVGIHSTAKHYWLITILNPWRDTIFHFINAPKGDIIGLYNVLFHLYLNHYISISESNCWGIAVLVNFKKLKVRWKIERMNFYV